MSIALCLDEGSVDVSDGGRQCYSIQYPEAAASGQEVSRTSSIMASFRQLVGLNYYRPVTRIHLNLLVPQADSS